MKRQRTNLNAAEYTRNGLRILFFGSGSPASATVLGAVTRVASVVGVVAPGNAGAAPLLEVARRHRLKTHTFGRDLISRIDPRPDLICVATFPSVLSRELLALAPGVNVHWSLLPRHRGPDPLFWTYLNDDRETGLTIHWLDEHVDAGPILLQQAIPLERGRPLLDLYHDLSGRAADLMVQAIHLVETGTAPRIAQDEALATHERSRAVAEWSIDAVHWPAERVWHVLRGLTVGTATLIGRAHGTARAYAVNRHDRPPGTIESTENGLRVWCFDGYVDADPARRATLFRRLMSRLRPQARTSARE